MTTPVFAPQSATDSREFVQSFNADGSANFSQVGFDQLNFNGIFGPTVTSTTSNTVAIGTPTFTLDIDDGVSFLINDLVQAISLDDTTCWMYGIITSKDTSASPAEITLLAFRTSNVTITSANWQLQVVGRNWGEAEQTGYSSTNLTIAAGSNTFTTQSGKYFPIQAPVRITDLTTPANQYFGTVVAYSGSSLIVNVPSTSIFGSDSASSTWSIYCMGPPETRIGLYQMNGLQITTDFITNRVFINAGSVRDSKDTIDLVVSSPLTISTITGSSSVISASQTGTITSSGNSVTGTGTSFTTNFSATATLTDLSNQLSSLGLSALSFPTVITDPISHWSASTTVVTDNTHLTTDGTLSAGATDSFTRGGFQNVPLGGHSIAYGVYIAYQTSTGAVNGFMTSFTPSGVPDLPAGYTYYRIIGYIIFGTNSFVSVSQPLAINVLTTAGDVPFFGSVTAPGGATVQEYLQRLPIGSQFNVQTVSSSGLPSWGQVNLTTSAAVTGVLQVANGGTSATSLGTGLSNSGASLAVSLTVTSNTLTGDVNLSNSSNYFDGPSVAQGTSGTWLALGNITITSPASQTIAAKLWDGTNIIASGEGTIFSGGNNVVISLSGVKSSPSGNIRMSCKVSSTSAKIAFNASGNSADSSVTCVRVG